MTGAVALMRYDAARRALEEARSIDEIAEVINKTDALRLYAHQAKDTEMETWAAEIKLRAVRRCGELIRELATGAGTRTDKPLPDSGKRLKREALAAANLSTSAAHRYEAIAAIPNSDFEAYIAGRAAAGQPVYATEAIKAVRNQVRRRAALAARGAHRADTTADLAALAARAAAGAIPKFAAIYADPAWEFETWSAKGTGRSAEMHYKTMSDAEIEALGEHVDALAADDCALFLWGVMPKLPAALSAIAAWGFAYKTCGFTWIKTGKSAPDSQGGGGQGGGWHRGMGKWTQSNAELCLLATRGAPYRLAEDVEQLLVAPVGRHSAKPEEARARLERLVGGPYLELFGRDAVPGWTVWGNEVGADAATLGSSSNLIRGPRDGSRVVWA